MIAWLFLLISSALAYDHSQWQRTLDQFVSDKARVDYAGIAQTGALESYLAGLASASVPTDSAQALALWINAYNAITIHVVSQSWPLGSIRELDAGAVWRRRRFTVAGESLTLDQIEKKKIALLGDPRTHAVLNCASLGCPPLSSVALTGANLETQLSQATHQWLRGKGVVIDREKREVILSSIFDWYAKDFPDPGGLALPGVEGRMQGPLKFIARYLPPDEAAYIMGGHYSVRFAPFDWAVNSR